MQGCPRCRNLPKQAALNCWITCWITVLGCICASDAVLLLQGDPAVAAEVEPAIIGADGPEFTQVAAAQNVLRLSGAGVRACILDEGVDWRNKVFGACTAPGVPAPPECRIYFGYNAIDNTTDPMPTDEEDYHGTHVASICAGSYQSTRLVDAQGVPLPFQRGVAYRALIGAIKSNLKNIDLKNAFPVARSKKCDIINMSWGGTTVATDKGYPYLFANLTGEGIITTAAAGNDGFDRGGDVLFRTGSPSNIAPFSVAALNNTANPGATLQLSRAIKTPTGQRKTLAAILRSDTLASICMPSCKGIRLPVDLVLLKSRPARSDSCFPPATITETTQLEGKAIVLQVAPDCTDWLYGAAEDLWAPLLLLKPALLLLALPRAGFPATSGVGPVQMPTLYLDPDDGAALAAALEEDTSSGALELQALPGAKLLPLPADYAMQPTKYSSWGPGVDLHLEPSIAAPGNLYAALPGDTFQLWEGTSMATPYFSGVAALWLQHIRRTQSRPPKGAALVEAAQAAFLNTARPIPYEDTELMWPPAKVGAGVVQAYNAVINTVAITPPQVLLRTDTGAGQRHVLTLTNTGTEHITYTISHKPAVGVSFSRSWYAQAVDLKAPSAQVISSLKSITVLAGGKTSLIVTFRLPPGLRELDNLVSGYITFTPIDHQAVETDTAASASGSKQPALPRLVPLSVPYQGATKDWSSFGGPSSLALFATPMPELNAVAAAKLQGKPQVYICSGIASDDLGTCEYQPGEVKLPPWDDDSGTGRITFAAALVRPVANLTVAVYSGDGSQLLGRMKPIGGCLPSAPFSVSRLNYDWCDAAAGEAKYLPTGSKNYVRFRLNETYSFRVQLRPVLSAADRLAGMKRAKPLEIVVPNTVRIVQLS